MKDDYGFNRLHSEYFYHLIDDGREYRIYRKSNHALVGGGYLPTVNAAIAEANRHIARLQRSDMKTRKEAA